MLWKWILMTWQNAMSICKADINPAKFSTTCHMSTWQIVRANSNHTASPGMYVYVLGTKKINNQPTNPHSTPQTDGDLARLLLSSIKRTFFSISIFLLNLHILSLCYNAEVMASITLQGFKTCNHNQGFYTNNNFDTKGFFTCLQKSHYIDVSQPLYMVPTNLWKGWELILQNICWCWAWLVLLSYPKYFPVYNIYLTETMSIGSSYFYAVTAGKQIINISSQFEARKMWWSLDTKPCLCSREQLW